LPWLCFIGQIAIVPKDAKVHFVGDVSAQSDASKVSEERTMFWAKQRFKWCEYLPYKERIQELMVADPEHYDQFIMMSTYVRPSLSEYYVGVPSEALLAMFDGFEPVDANSDRPRSRRRGE
jgi:hypothetical protein